jgi:hypothetical protein
MLGTDELLTPGEETFASLEAKLRALVSHGVCDAVQASPCAQRTPMGGSKGVIERGLPRPIVLGSKGGEGAAGALVPQRRKTIANGRRPVFSGILHVRGDSGGIKHSPPLTIRTGANDRRTGRYGKASDDVRKPSGATKPRPNRAAICDGAGGQSLSSNRSTMLAGSRYADAKHSNLIRASMRARAVMTASAKRPSRWRYFNQNRDTSNIRAPSMLVGRASRCRNEH